MQVFRHHIQDLALGQKTEFDDRIIEAQTFRPLQRRGFRQLNFGQQTVPQQQM